MIRTAFSAAAAQQNPVSLCGHHFSRVCRVIFLPRFGIVAAGLGMSVFLSLWMIPFPRAWPRVAGPIPAPLTSPLCFHLQCDDSTSRARLPSYVALRPEAYAAGEPHRPAFVAKVFGADSWPDLAWWAFAGRDSVDVTGHHQALLRIPRRGGRGWAIPYVESSVSNMLLFSSAWPQPRSLAATVRACGEASEVRTP